MVLPPLSPPAVDLNTDLDTARMAFLARHGRAGDVLVQLPADASARSYYRVSGAQMLLMQDSRDLVGFAAFVQLAQHLQNLGLSAPRVFAHDASAGLALIEDFGTETYGALLRAKDADGNATEAALYALAVDALVHLHSQPNACAVPAPAYDTALLLDEVSRLSHWLVPEIAPHVDVQAFDAGFRALWLRALAPLQDVRPALVLRDFHIDNLMLLRARSGVAACGLLDFQDAVIGAGEYDLASLLQDARRDLGAGLEQAMLQRYVQAAPPTWGTRGDILHRYYVLAAQRHTRLMGQFVRLMRRDGKPSYLAFMPRVARQMQRALLDANLTDISDYLDTHLPNWRGAGQAMAALS